MNTEIEMYDFVDYELKDGDTQEKEELDQYIKDFGIAYEKWEGAEMLNPTATRIWFLLKELKELRDAKRGKSE